MADFFPPLRGNVDAVEDRKDNDPVPPIHPRLRLAAQTKIERLRHRLCATYADAAERLQIVIAQVRAFVVERKDPGAWAILSELEGALADIRSLAATEFLDTSGIASLERKLTLANEGLKALHDRSAASMQQGAHEA